MNTHTFHAPFNPRDMISERAARRAAAHPRTAAPPDAGAPAAAETPQILRRWSVAELVAAATWPRVVASAMFPPPATDG